MPQKRRSEQPKDASAGRKNQDPAVLHAAALRLAARHGWLDITPAEVYAEAGLTPPAKLPPHIWPWVADILARLDTQVDVDVSDRLGGSWRDDLFELLMTRFDLMQENRDAYSDIMPAALNRPCQSGSIMTQRLTRMADGMLARAQVPVTGVRRHAAVATLAGIYLSLLETWRQDESADLAKTMAAVDQRLNWLQKVLDGMSGGQAD